MGRPVDTVRIEIVGQGGATTLVDRFTSFGITHDITQPSEAAFEIGDHTTWDSLSAYIAPGTKYKVSINGGLHLTGRVELDDIPMDAQGGASVRFTIRTKLADAQYASANPKVATKAVSIKAFLLALYQPLGYAASDFVFTPYAARDLITGRDSSGQGKPTSVDLEPMKEDQAKVQNGETIWEAADRHLRRHGLMHWDSPDGKIVVGSPNDTQEPTYHLRANRLSHPELNNILSATRSNDYSGIPSMIVVYGRMGKPGVPAQNFGVTAVDTDVIEAGFYRPVTLQAEGIRTIKLGQRAVNREMSARRKAKDNWEILVDGLAYWTGQEPISWAVDTTCDIESDIAGGALGAYYIHRVMLRRDPAGGDVTNIVMLKKGIWVL